MKKHPFLSLVPKGTKKLLVGTLPPEDVHFYFSNSDNTRLWDLLKTIDDNSPKICKGSNKLKNKEKRAILKKLKLGISDVIFKYEREIDNSTKDQHIIPYEYKKLLELASRNDISEILFVYQNALRWFEHSLTSTTSVRIRNLKMKYPIGFYKDVKFENKIIRCSLLPSPLNRGKKGETLEYKCEIYRKHILDI